MNITIPNPRIPITVRPGTRHDLPFIDHLLKQHTAQVGWMPRQQLEMKIAAGHVLVPVGDGCEQLGYCIGTDQYFKRDDLGIIYQVNVVADQRRSLVGATLVKAMFDRSAYGCKLFCCWCAQDLEANRFWESLGFVALAFRTGSRKRGKPRVHIFWQRRIRGGDDTTPYWFPSRTSSGSIREDRIVLPIPPGMRWDDEMPVILPRAQSDESRALPPKRGRDTRGNRRIAPTAKPQIRPMSGGLIFAPQVVAVDPPKEVRPPKPKVKSDPKLVAAARELRDRWLERVNAGEYLPQGRGKYDVSRFLGHAQQNDAPLLIEQAA